MGLLEQQSIRRRSNRVRLIARRFRQAKKRGGWIVLLPILALAITGFWWEAKSNPFFIVKKVEVIGDLKELTVDGVIRAALLPADIPLFNVPLKEVEENIRKMPWVQWVSVRRQVPSTLWIYIREHKPRALLLQERLYFISQEGLRFKRVETESQRDLPVLTGLKNEEQIHQAMHLLDLIEESEEMDGLEISEIHFDPTLGFSLVTLAHAVEIRLGTQHFENKLHQFKKIWPELAMRFGNMRGIDLSYDDRAFVKL